MDDATFIREYLERYKQAIFGTDVTTPLLAMRDRLLKAKKEKKKVILAGNGASAAMAAHTAIDLTKQGGIRALTFNETALITAFSNDCGYDAWIRKTLEFYADPGDVVVLISVSGSSPNVVQAAQYAKENGISIITFTGSQSDNPLRNLGDINFWVDSMAYNIVENTHSIWLLAVCDLVIGHAEYTVKGE